ncbi:ABC transporter permease [Asanoa sp. NPDC049518]|uniref:ABC transporter permease n=1 Tax=unclassified Asanoa TaxID=2685164 RepID=UPI00341ABEF0
MTGLTARGVVRAEWTKLLSLRSTWVVLGTTAVLTVAFGGLIGWNQARAGDAPTVAGAFLPIDLFSLVLGVFGVLLMTGEFSSGLVRSTFAAVPRRLPVLWAKAAALTVATLPVLAVTCVAALLVNQAFADGDPITLADPGVLRATAGAAAAPLAMGLVGLAVGTLLRHTALAIALFVTTLLVLPAILPAALPDDVAHDVLRFVPVAASQAMYAVSADGGPFELLAPGQAALVLAGWVVVLLAAAAFVLRRRDA